MCNGFCVECPSYKELFTQKEFEYNDTLCHPYNLIINVTDRCTHACKYCFVNQSAKDMPYEVAEACCERVLANAKYHPGCKPGITFFGGEPMMKFHSIIAPLVKKYSDRIGFSVTTNGFLLTPDETNLDGESVVDFLIDHDVAILFSMDGDKETQMKNRPAKDNDQEKVFDIIEENLKYLLARTNRPVLVRATVPGNSIKRMFHNWMYFKSLGVDEVFFGINQLQNYSEAEVEMLFDQWKKIGLDIYWDLIEKRRPMKSGNLVSMFQKIHQYEMQPSVDTSLMHCGLATFTAAVTTSGKIIPCQEESSNPWINFGSVFNEEMDREVHERFLRWHFSQMTHFECMKHCKPELQVVCRNTYCPNTMRNEDNTEYLFTQGHCVSQKAIYEAAKSLYVLCRNSPLSPMFRAYFEGGPK